MTTSDREKLLLVDYENVQQVELTRLDDSYGVKIFVGANQKSLPFELVTVAQQLGSRVEWQKVGGEGRNALDFFIACELGKVMTQDQKPECIVLSKDKGFDPLLKHLTAEGLRCRRISNLSELRHELRSVQPPPRREVRQAPPTPRHEARPVSAAPRHEARQSSSAGASDAPNVRRVVELLGKLEKKGRPRKRKTLAQSISAMFQNRLSREDVDIIVSTLLYNKTISEANGIITYNF